MSLTKYAPLTDVKYDILWNQSKVFFASRNHLNPLYPVVRSLEKLLQQIETVASYPQITISSFNPAEEVYSP